MQVQMNTITARDLAIGKQPFSCQFPGKRLAKAFCLAFRPLLLASGSVMAYSIAHFDVSMEMTFRNV